MEPKNWIELVAEFHAARGGTWPNQPTGDIHRDVEMLRIKLMTTELGELTEAMHIRDKAEILDALCDLLYVVCGTAIEYGMLPILDEAYREIHSSNMSKDHRAIAAGEKYGPHGKGKNYRPPNLEAIITNYMAGRPRRKIVLCKKCKNEVKLYHDRT